MSAAGSVALPFGADNVCFRKDGREIVIGCTDHYGEIWQGALVVLSIEGSDVKEINRIETYTGVSG